MVHLLHAHWLWVFGATALGIVGGWLAYLPGAARWTDRPRLIAGAVVAIGIALAVAQVIPRRYGHALELAAFLAAFVAIGAFIGWALRDLAEFTPAAARPGTAGSGSYLFREALAGTGTGSAYMRTRPDEGRPARQRLPLPAGALTQAPAPGGYTFPRTRPFADATTSRPAETPQGLRRHWSFPRADGAAAAPQPAAFAGTKGGYVFPATAQDLVAATSRVGTTGAGALKHWSWRNDAAAPAPNDATRVAAAEPTIAGPSEDAPGAEASAQAGTAPPSEPAPQAPLSVTPISETFGQGDPAGGAAPALPPESTTTSGLPAAPPAAPGEPATIAAVPGEERHAGARPQGLMGARDDRPDDLKRIRGIGPQNEGRLHGLGIWHFDQIAGWDQDNVRWVSSYLAFPGRIDRERWVEQARTLVEGGGPPAADPGKRPRRPR